MEVISSLVKIQPAILASVSSSLSLERQDGVKPKERLAAWACVDVCVDMQRVDASGLGGNLGGNGLDYRLKRVNQGSASDVTPHATNIARLACSIDSFARPL